jgi:hypothetical protein
MNERGRQGRKAAARVECGRETVEGDVMEENMKRSSWIKISTFLIGVMLTTASALVGGCDFFDDSLCIDVSDDICSELFDCFPEASASSYDDHDTCRLAVMASCADSGSLSSCDINNDDLRNCQNAIDSSGCASLPASCQVMLDCVD